jgi:SNF2 family DNA or RNA helicase
MDYGYQVPGVDFLARHKRAFLADEPGLGKTVQAIKAAQKIGAKDILVICPLTGVNYWQQEFSRWWEPSEDSPLPVVIVVSYHILSEKGHPTRKLLATAPPGFFDVMICDEAHYLKTPGSIRTKTVYQHLLSRTKRVWLLSGTPAPNNAGELWPHVYNLRPDLITDPGAKLPLDKEMFEDRYCNVEFDPKYQSRRIRGSKNLGELRVRVAPFILRRRKTEVLPDLPPMVVETYPLAATRVQLTPGSRKVDRDLGTFAQEMDADALLDVMSQGQHEKDFATLRHEIGLLKVDPAADHIEEELQNPGKVVVFGWHRDVLAKLTLDLEARGFDPVLIVGSTPLSHRDIYVKKFQDPRNNCRVFVGQTLACGELITLTEGRMVIFVESSWNPMQNVQAAARIHRIGQTRGTTARFLVLPGTSDVYQQAVLARKARDFAQLFD